jgi:serine/threonine-protein kinase
VPTLTDQRQDAAKSQLEAAGLVLGPVSTQHSKTVPAGTVISSDPAGGTTAHKGDRVRLVVSDGQVTLPDLHGKAIDDADTQVQDLGLSTERQPTGDCADVPPDAVITQSPAAGDVPQGSQVVLTYCDASLGQTTPTDSTTPVPTESDEPAEPDQ